MAKKDVSLEQAISVTNGGRSLNAIWANPNLDVYETILLQYLGSQADFTSGFTKARYESQARIMAATKMSKRKLNYVASGLEKRGYIVRQQRVENGTKIPSLYSLTMKIFNEYAEKLAHGPDDDPPGKEGGGSAQDALGVVHGVHEGSAQHALGSAQHALGSAQHALGSAQDAHKLPPSSLMPPSGIPQIVLVASNDPPPGTKVWLSYAEAYRAQYHQEPVRNAKTNALCLELIRRLGEDAAPKVAAFYVTHRKAWYTSNLHALEWCVKDAEALHTQWLAGQQMTTSTAAQMDRQQSNAEVAAAVLRDLAEERRRGGK